MSSHHFVKEGQEPALLILDALTFDVAGPLLEWAPLLVVVQPALDDVLLWNIKIDVVIAREKDVKDLSSRLAGQAPLTILSHTSDESALINALYFLIRKKQNAVNIISSSANAVIAMAENFVDQIQINVIDGSVKWSAVASGHFQKWMSAGTRVFIKESFRQQSIDLNGLKKVGDHYESIVDGMVRLESESLFWFGETRFAEPRASFI
jgi:hypothetical protein